MRAIAAIVFALGLLAPAAAQVIQGESTYEDNFVHVPPAPDQPAKADARSSAGPERAGTQEEQRRRDRD